MNKSDVKLIIGILSITIIILFCFSKIDQKKAKMAVIYYQNEVVETIDLSKKEIKEYKVNGKNGPIIIEVNDGKIRVKEEKSPLHICSKQGYISKSTETIICLPNEIVIQIEEKDTVDTVVR